MSVVLVLVAVFVAVFGVGAVGPVFVAAAVFAVGLGVGAVATRPALA